MMGFAPRSPDLPSGQGVAEVAGQFLASSCGFGALPWWPYIGYAVGALLAFSCVMVVVCWWRQPAERVRSAGLLLFFVGLVGLALAIGWGRAGFGSHQGFSYRYSMLAAPMLCGVFYLGELTGKAALARFLQMALFTCLGVLLVPNTEAGVYFGKYKHDQVQPVEDDLQPNYSARQIAAKHQRVCRNRDYMETCLDMLREAGIGKYKRLSPPRVEHAER